MFRERLTYIPRGYMYDNISKSNQVAFTNVILNLPLAFFLSKTLHLIKLYRSYFINPNLSLLSLIIRLQRTNLMNLTSISVCLQSV
jgi:hypothetical protein